MNQTYDAIVTARACGRRIAFHLAERGTKTASRTQSYSSGSQVTRVESSACITSRRESELTFASYNILSQLERKSAGNVIYPTGFMQMQSGA